MYLVTAITKPRPRVAEYCVVPGSCCPHTF